MHAHINNHIHTHIHTQTTHTHMHMHTHTHTHTRTHTPPVLPLICQVLDTSDQSHSYTLLIYYFFSVTSWVSAFDFPT